MSNAFQFCLKDFKLKMIVVEPKIAQLVELVNLFNSTCQTVQKPLSLSFRMLVQLVKVEFQSIEVQRSLVKH